MNDPKPLEKKYVTLDDVRLAAFAIRSPELAKSLVKKDKKKPQTVK